MCDLGDERVIGVGVCQHRANTQQHCEQLVLSTSVNDVWRVRTLANGERWAPLVSQNVQADASVRVDVGVVDAGSEVDLRGLERVVGREVDCEEEYTAGVW